MHFPQRIRGLLTRIGRRRSRGVHAFIYRINSGEYTAVGLLLHPARLQSSSSAVLKSTYLEWESPNLSSLAIAPWKGRVYFPTV